MNNIKDKSNEKIVIFAPNIFIGGGLNQLLEVLNDFNDVNINLYLVLDSRIKNEIKKIIKNKFTNTTFISKKYLFVLIYDFYINFIIKPNKVIALSNYPSIFCFKKNQYLFLQNRYYLNEKIDKSFFKKIKISYIKFIINFKIKTFVKVIVQTQLMKNITNQYLLKNKVPISIYFSFKYLKKYKIINKDKKWDFIYPADNAIHKNHNTLIHAIIELSKESIRPSFLFTIKEKSKLDTLISLTNNKYETKINNLGVISEKKCLENINCSRYLIYPSRFESLGLPLIEANILNIPIISSDEEYVKEVCEPIATFDSLSIEETKKIIKKFYFKTNVIPPKKFYKSNNFLELL